VFENRVLKRIFGPKRDGMTGGWRKLRNEKLHNLYCSSDIIRMIVSRNLRWTGHGGDEKCVQKFCRKTWSEKSTWKI
jgi:hypothetical protein